MRIKTLLETDIFTVAAALNVLAVARAQPHIVKMLGVKNSE